MVIGVMQPYFMPYLGYWQLINYVDKYVVLDDVTFIKGGFINRNSILSQGRPLSINIHVNGISQNKLICDHQLNEEYKWRKKLLTSISQNYSKAPYFGEVFPLLEECIKHENNNLSENLFFQIKRISDFLDIKTDFVKSSELDLVEEMRGQDRIINIVKSLEGTKYVNPAGGKELYQKEVFEDNGIDLKFIEMERVEYPQMSKSFVPNLSIIDILMFNSKTEIKLLLDKCNLV